MVDLAVQDTAAATILSYRGSQVIRDDVHGLRASDVPFNVGLAGWRPTPRWTSPEREPERESRP